MQTSVCHARLTSLIVYFLDWMLMGLVTNEQHTKQTTLHTEGAASEDERPDLGCEICWEVSDSCAYSPTQRLQKGKHRKLQYRQYIASSVDERIPEEKYFLSLASKGASLLQFPLVNKLIMHSVL